MALAHVIGIDHVVINVRSLDAAAERWRRLGFTVSPRGQHSAHLGTANHTIMLDPDYIELLGVLEPTEHNARTRLYLERREGMERVALTALDAAKGVEELKARGITATGPVDFGRPVDLPGGKTGEARFRTLFWPAEERPGGVRLFACQHLTRETVWIPELMRHANAAERLVRVEVLARDAKAAAEHMARFIDGAPLREADGAWRVASGGGRADFVFLDRATLARRHPGIPLDGLGEEGAATIIIKTKSLAAAAKAVGTAGRASADLVTVPPVEANGVLLAFVS